MFLQIPRSLPWNQLTYSRFVRFYHNHYEVLKLPSNCSKKQIRDAFIKLSKEHHPDVNKSTLSHKKFVQISDAYKVLGKKESRLKYDLGLAGFRRRTVSKTRRDYNREPIFHTHRETWYDSRFEPYYGIRGMEKISNRAVVVLCIIFAFVGTVLEILLVRHSFACKRENLIKKSNETEETMHEIRKVAATNGNRAQIENLKTKMWSGYFTNNKDR